MNIKKRNLLIKHENIKMMFENTVKKSVFKAMKEFGKTMGTAHHCVFKSSFYIYT